MNAKPLVPKLGVGLAFQPTLREFIADKADTFDYLEVVPDTLWTDRGLGRVPRYVDGPEGLALMRRVRAERQVVPHSIGLSIGSAHRFDREHLEQIARWHSMLDFPWHSDHLAYHLAEHGIDEMNVGVTLPLPRDRETLDALAPRIAEVRARLPIPFLLENNVYFFDLPGAEWSDAGFLNRLAEETGCHLLLDLHNVHVNSRNHGTDPYRLLGELDLDRVLELHVAGGMEHNGFYLDAHCGPMPEEVWRLLEYALPRCPNLGGVTFELLGSWFPEMGAERLERELAGMRERWLRWQPAPERAAARAEAVRAEAVRAEAVR
jgi:uncharacterized protein (UPF0276 family)